MLKLKKCDWPLWFVAKVFVQVWLFICPNSMLYHTLSIATHFCSCFLVFLFWGTVVFCGYFLIKLIFVISKDFTGQLLGMIVPWDMMKGSYHHVISSGNCPNLALPLSMPMCQDSVHRIHHHCHLYMRHMLVLICMDSFQIVHAHSRDIFKIEFVNSNAILISVKCWIVWISHNCEIIVRI